MKIEQKPSLNMIPGNPPSSPEKGQSLVEFALILPILLLMLLGVFEVGWALRGYLSLTNANREAARFASRGVYLDFDEKEDALQVGYEKVITHTMDSLADQLAHMNFLGVNPDDNASLIMTYYSVDPGVFACPGDPECTNFDCGKFLNPAYDGTGDEPGFDIDDLNDIEYPILYAPPPYDGGYDLPDYYETRIAADTQAGLVDHFEAITSYHYHSGGPFFSRIDPEEKVAEFRAESNKLNCELRKKGFPESDLKVVVVENTFHQDLLSGLFIISRFTGNQVPLYTHTAMRINPAARQEIDEEENGCALYPIMIPSSIVSGKKYGDWPIYVPITNNAPGTPGNFGLIFWSSDTPGANNQGALADNFKNPQNSAESYVEPNSNPADTSIGIGDWIQVTPGNIQGNEVRDALDALKDDGTQLLFPVWNDSDCLTGGACINAQGSGVNSRMRTFTFVRMILTETYLKGGDKCPEDFPDYPGANKCLEFQFVSMESNACMAGRDE